MKTSLFLSVTTCLWAISGITGMTEAKRDDEAAAVGSFAVHAMHRRLGLSDVFCFLFGWLGFCDDDVDPDPPVVITFDQAVTQTAGNLLFGTGNANGGFTVAKKGCLELGLRGKVRFPTPQNTFNSDGAGTYTFQAGLFNTGTDRASWSYEFHINTDTCCTTPTSCAPINTYDYELCVDADPSPTGTAFQCGDVVNGDVKAPGFFCPDHSLGTYATLPEQGVEANCMTGGKEAYRNLIAQNHILQQSWQPSFFIKVGWWLNFCATGTYDITLSAINKTTKNEVAKVAIKIETTAHDNANPCQSLGFA